MFECNKVYQGLVPPHRDWLSFGYEEFSKGGTDIQVPSEQHHSLFTVFRLVHFH